MGATVDDVSDDALEDADRILSSMRDVAIQEYDRDPAWIQAAQHAVRRARDVDD